jgi:hypothetical protein
MDKTALRRIGKELVKRIYGTSPSKVHRGDYAAGEYFDYIQKGFKSKFTAVPKETSLGSIAKSTRVRAASERSKAKQIVEKGRTVEREALGYAAKKQKAVGIKNPRFVPATVPRSKKPLIFDEQIYQYLKAKSKV